MVNHLNARSALAVFAHADDETLVAGTLADAASQKDTTVQTVTLTKGKKGYSKSPVCRADDLRVVREAEHRKYGFFVGIDDPKRVD